MILTRVQSTRSEKLGVKITSGQRNVSRATAGSLASRHMTRSKNSQHPSALPRSESALPTPPPSASRPLRKGDSKQPKSQIMTSIKMRLRCGRNRIKPLSRLEVQFHRKNHHPNKGVSPSSFLKDTDIGREAEGRRVRKAKIRRRRVRARRYSSSLPL